MKKINWKLIIAIILIIILAIVIINNKLSSSDKKEKEENKVPQVQESEYTDLKTSNDDLAAIDETLELLD